MMAPASLKAAATVCLASLLLSGCAGGAETPAASEQTTMSGSKAAPAKKDKKVGATDQAPSKAELKAYAARAERQVTSAFGSFNGMYSEIRIDPVYPNGIEFVYVLSEFVEVSAATTNYLNTTVPVLRTAFRTQVAPEMEALGVARPKVTYTYLNPDDSLIWTRTFTRS